MNRVHDKSPRDNFGMTPLQMAVAMGHNSVRRLIHCDNVVCRDCILFYQKIFPIRKRKF